MGHVPFQKSSVSALTPTVHAFLLSPGVTSDVLPTTSLAISTEFLSLSLDLRAECCLAPSQELLANLEK